VRPSMQRYWSTLMGMRAFLRWSGGPKVWWAAQLVGIDQTLSYCPSSSLLGFAFADLVIALQT
jgi:hypothetical protein